VSRIEPTDIQTTAAICCAALNALQVQHVGRPLDFPSIESALGCHVSLSTHPKTYGVVARDSNGRIVGSNFLDQRGEAASVGPTSVDPPSQGLGVDHALMQAVIAKALADGHKSIRLAQEVYNTASFSLYVKLGFEPREQLFFFMGRCAEDWPDKKRNLAIRPMTVDDVAACADLYKRVVGVDREVEIRDCLSTAWVTYHDEPLVAEEEGRIVGYATSVTLPGHSVGENDEVVARIHYEMTQQVSASRSSDAILLKVIGRLSPTLVKWALKTAGLRLQRMATLMALGTYTEPTGGTYIPSSGY